jgi:hypothetical protein
MENVVKCELCDTTLEFEDDGHRFRYLAHTPEMCRSMTLHRIRTLEGVLKQNAETCQRSLERVVRQIDVRLKELGVEELTSWTRRMAQLNEIKLAQARALALRREDVDTDIFNQR